MANEKQKTMQAAALDRFGNIDAIRLQAVPIPEVKPDEVLIRVEVAGVASWDAREREGMYDSMFGSRSKFPYILGWDGAGVIAAIGDQVKHLKAGDRVYAATMPIPRGGFYAEYTVVPTEHVSLIPPKLSVDEAGVMPWCALTALSGLDALNLKEGESLMIFGASGGLGHLAVQLAKQMGVRVFAVASGKEGVSLVKSLGADKAIDGRKDDVVAAAREFAPEGLDAALVTAGGDAVDHALTAMRKDSRVARPDDIGSAPKVPSGVRLISYNGDTSQAGMAKLNRMIAAGPFKVHIAHMFSLSRAAEAHKILATQFIGKVGLRIS